MCPRCARHSNAGSDGHSYVVTVPGRGYRLVGIDSGSDVPAYSGPGETPARGTSVAVLRFANLSGDSSQDYFADGSWRTSSQDFRVSPGCPWSAVRRACCSRPAPAIWRVSGGSWDAAISCREACARRTIASGSRRGWWNPIPAWRCGLNGTIAGLMIFSRFRMPSR